jgi:hypothetical protein
VTAKELIAKLQQFNPESEVMVLDSHNGGGTPRTINLGPTFHHLTAGDSEEAADCEDRIGELVVLMGYGCY